MNIVHFIKTDFKDIKIIEWILASPEINIIESLCSIVKRNLITNKVQENDLRNGCSKEKERKEH